MDANNKHIEVDLKKFVVFILSHGRPHLKDTYKTLRICGYTGKIVVICDNEDDTIEEYFKEYGKENVYIFDKQKWVEKTDSMNNNGKRNAVVFARNACWDIAKELGYEYFQMLDDDYYYFGHKGLEHAKRTLCYNLIVKWFLDFLINQRDNVKTIAFCQGGDLIGGVDNKPVIKRKAMNSFFCMTNRPIVFKGLINEDVNAYIEDGIRGGLYITYMRFKLDQGVTQQNDAGLTDIYLDAGTYIKSYYTSMISPVGVNIWLMGLNDRRLHHKVNYKKTMPCIISEDYKKK